MSKKKAELTLEELQARKSKRQRGWVRVCAIILAIVLTGGVYGLAAKGGPRKQKYAPSVVQVNGGTVVQKEESKAPAEEAPAPAPAPSTSEEEGGGILDTLMGLISGIDFGSLIEKLNPGQLGITVADKIDVFKDNLLDKINEIQGSINKKPAVTHEAVVENFPEVDMDAELNAELNKQFIITTLKAYTKGMENGTLSYTVKREKAFAEDGNVNIGAKTETVNTILSTVSKGELSLDAIASEFTGIGESKVTVAEGQTYNDAVSAVYPDASDSLLPFIQKTAPHTVELTSDDFWVESYDSSLKLYKIRLKNVENPNRATVCGFTKVSPDFVVQNEVASLIKNKVAIQGTNFGLLKLTDLDTYYNDICIELCVEPGWEQVKVTYAGKAKFVVRTNSVQITGKAATNTALDYMIGDSLEDQNA